MFSKYMPRVDVCVCVLSECPADRFGSDCQDRCECLNGAQCDGQTGRCVCQPGWTGQHCENGKIIYRRLLNPGTFCDVNQSLSNSSPSFVHLNSLSQDSRNTSTLEIN